MPDEYPTSFDLASFLGDAATASTPNQRAQAISEATAKWESMTQTPFLAEAVASTHYYDQGEGATLWLPPYISITSVMIGVTYDSTTGDEVDGVELVRNVGYFVSDELPIRSLRFTQRHRAGRRGIKIVGRRGYTATLTNEVWSAILKGAAASVYKSARNAATNGLSSIAIGSGDLQVTFAGIEKTVAADWEAAFKDAASNPNYRSNNL